METNLVFEAAGDAGSSLQALAEIDLDILGFRRDVDHKFLMQDRSLYLYRRGGSVVGYGYIDRDYCGPFALLDDADFPAVLAYAETKALSWAPDVGWGPQRWLDHWWVAYRLTGFMGSIMSKEPFGKFRNYILTNPPIFL
jgi:hypothetical protein